MHFISMLGYTITGQAITYNVPVTILSMLIAVSVVAVGLLIVGFGRDGDWRRLLLGGSRASGASRTPLPRRTGNRAGGGRVQAVSHP
jgi:NO-binding membrane sensor protein with MHYT domain